TRGLQVGVLEEALGAGVEAIEDVLVGPLEVEGIVERLAHARVGELGPAHVEEEPLRARGAIVGQGELLHAAVPDGGDVVGSRPVAGCELLAQVEGAGLEAFEAGCAVAVVLEAQLVEVETAAIDGQVLAPVVAAALVADERTDLEVA